jgi:hypothetical protein
MHPDYPKIYKENRRPTPNPTVVFGAGMCLVLSGAGLGIESVDEHKVRFIDREQFEGLLLPMQAKDLEANGLSAMVAMGEALKKRVK